MNTSIKYLLSLSFLLTLMSSSCLGKKVDPENTEKVEVTFKGRLFYSDCSLNSPIGKKSFNFEVYEKGLANNYQGYLSERYSTSITTDKDGYFETKITMQKENFQTPLGNVSVSLYPFYLDEVFYINKNNLVLDLGNLIYNPPSRFAIKLNTNGKGNNYGVNDTIFIQDCFATGSDFTPKYPFLDNPNKIGKLYVVGPFHDQIIDTGAIDLGMKGYGGFSWRQSPNYELRGVQLKANPCNSVMDTVYVNLP